MLEYLKAALPSISLPVLRETPASYQQLLTGSPQGPQKCLLNEFRSPAFTLLILQVIASPF